MSEQEDKPPQTSKPTKKKTAKNKKACKPSHAQRLVQMAFGCGVKFWRTTDREIWAQFMLNDHLEQWPIRTKPFKAWMSHRLYESSGDVVNKQAVSDAVAMLDALGQEKTDIKDISMRVAGKSRLRDGFPQIILDLTNDRWETVQIDRNGWEVVDGGKIMFRRTQAALALPQPNKDEPSTEPLRELLNIQDDEMWCLLLAFLVGCLNPTGPYPVLALKGEQGSGKSTVARIARTLIDPNKAAIRRPPHKEHDLVVSAANNWILAFDNLSKMPMWLSDALCAITTGGGYGIRSLYSNDEEFVFTGARPVILTGIEDLLSRGDLADRSIEVLLEGITEYRQEDDLWEAFDLAAPKALSSLLWAAVEGINNYEDMKVPPEIRMADFASWAAACMPALGIEPNFFLKAYMDNRQIIQEQALEGDNIAEAIRMLLEQDGFTESWAGETKELLPALKDVMPEDVTRQKSWPRNATSLGCQIRRVEPGLRRIGIMISRGQSGGRRYIRLEKSGQVGQVGHVGQVVPSVNTGFITTTPFSPISRDEVEGNPSNVSNVSMRPTDAESSASQSTGSKSNLSKPVQTKQNEQSSKGLSPEQPVQGVQGVPKDDEKGDFSWLCDD